MRLSTCRPLTVARSTGGGLRRKRVLRRISSSTNSDLPQPSKEQDLHLSKRRSNPLGIQMLSKPIYDQVFLSGRVKGPPDPSAAALERSIQHLKAQGLWEKECSTMAELNMRLPQMQGENLDEHFRAIAKTQSQPYLDLATKLVQAKLHPMPSKWSSETGWTHYDPKTGRGERVEYPADDALVLDVETCVIEGQRPILAVAVSPNAWYSWTSPRMASSQDFIEHMEWGTNLEDLIPMEPCSKGVNANSSKGVNDGSIKGVKDPSGSWDRPKLVVGHHVSYDRARLKEQYLIRVRARGGYKYCTCIANSM